LVGFYEFSFIYGKKRTVDAGARENARQARRNATNLRLIIF
jgi:hypothetical protein